MKGIILAGGSGSRLYPLTRIASKQLQAVYDKPMIYYPLTTLIECGIRDLCLISTPRDLPQFRELLGDGSGWGLSIRYVEQPQPGGIPQAFVLTQSFIGNGPVTLILGDNIFAPTGAFATAVREFSSGATIFGHYSSDPDRYGVVELDPRGSPVSIEEKPKEPRSNYVVPGIYIFDSQVSRLAGGLKPSERGELEIVDLNAEYLRQKKLRVHLLEQEFVWIDAGTSNDLYRATVFVRRHQEQHGTKLGCPEEAAFRHGLITRRHLEVLIGHMPASEYRSYLERLLAEG
jgi:glucose-1-phosphate thymidylyltransferase